MSAEDLSEVRALTDETDPEAVLHEIATATCAIALTGIDGYSASLGVYLETLLSSITPALRQRQSGERHDVENLIAMTTRIATFNMWSLTADGPDPPPRSWSN